MLYQYTFLFPLMITIGVVAMVVYLAYIAKKEALPDKTIDRMIVLIAISGAAMLFFANFFNSLFHWIKNPDAGFWNSGITYLGGFMGGGAVFTGLFFIFMKEEKKNIFFYLNYLITGVVLAHAFGRIGCFLAGCCYGGLTDAWYGITFPKGSDPSIAFSNGLEAVKVVPTQLIEAIFCFILFIVLFFRKKHQLAIYLVSYGVFRFLIEFSREDNRGSFIGSISPSQTLSILAIIIGIVLFFIPKLIEKENTNDLIQA